ncbi:P-loop containing nucleoside triphosphate hydrolase protein [Pleurotus eryngii]|uniref:P-loop containing nucleoside triphosphate hydrolase protein n=1 Tax=Pleurotus eryngii TaxID=5323 RepID=A0A9P5ZL28_PLEER|nr:P-loop containing nucleoside triphosphate hydrolase protein [Pleurotus eryngii]
MAHAGRCRFPLDPRNLLINIPGANIHRFGQPNSVAPVFRDVHWTVSEGENWAVVGSASGEKATLFQTLLGHLRISPPPPTSLFPMLLDGSDPYQKISMVSFGNRARGSGAFYDYSARYGAVREEDRITLRESVFPETIDEIVGELGYRQHEVQRANEEDMHYFEQLVDRMGLTKLLDLPVVALSNGQTRRARVVKAILRKPELLMLDEPLSGLDVQTRPALLSLLYELHSARRPRVILGLRIQDAVPEWVTHLALVDGGRIHTGTKDEIERLVRESGGLSEPSKVYSNVPKASIDHSGEILVDMNNVSVKYGDRTVLKAINWQIKGGERWHLVGANGSGKTTLLSLITGDHPQSYTQSSPLPASPSEPASQRHLRLFSRPRSRIPTPTLHSKIGVVSPELFDAFPRRAGLTVWEAVATGFEGVFSVPRNFVTSSGKPQRSVGGRVGEELTDSERQWRETRIWDVIEHLGPAAWATPGQDQILLVSEEFALRLFASLSVGEQRAVLLMRALVGQPPLIFLDEVWSGMDASMISAARSYLRGESGVRGDGKGMGKNQAVVVITHWENEVPWSAADGVKKFILESGVGKVVQ